MDTMKTVLVVDDQEFIRKIFAQMLAGIGNIKTLEAENGNAAMGVMRVSHPDLILMDITMPGKDGLQVLEEMRNDPSLFEIPVLVISAHADQEAHAMEMGAKAFINKVELNNINLPEMIKQHLGLI